MFHLPIHSQEYFPGEISGPGSGPGAHPAGQRRFPQAAVAQLPPQRHLRPPAPRRARRTLAAGRRRSLQAAAIVRLCHRPLGGVGREPPAAGLSFGPRLSLQQPRRIPLVVALVIALSISIFVVLFLAHITQNQKGQKVFVFLREEKRDNGVSCGRGRGTLYRGLVFMFVCVCVCYPVIVLCYCPLWQLFNSPLHPRAPHKDTVFWKKAHGFPQHPKRAKFYKTKQTNQKRKKNPQKRIFYVSGESVDFSEVRGGAFNHVYYDYDI